MLNGTGRAHDVTDGALQGTGGAPEKPEGVQRKELAVYCRGLAVQEMVQTCPPLEPAATHTAGH